MSKEADRLVVRAPAKVNLFLEVLGERKNGYHDIRSVIVPISLHDIVTLELADAVSCSMYGGSAVNGAAFRLPPPHDNLATKAALALKDVTGYSGGARITIEKHIPIGGGLGGGSADAAAVLCGLNDLWETGLVREQLMEIGSRIGCDIPAMVHGGAVCVEGLGEKISALQPAWQGKEKEGWLVVANPGFCVSTRDVYERCSPALTSQDDKFKTMISALEQGDWALIARSLYNGLQDTVLEKYPLIQILARGLREAGALGVLMSGSGASVFGVARDESHAVQIMDELDKSRDSSVWCVAVKALPDGVMVAHGPLEARV